MFSDKQWVDVPYCESEIESDPGLQLTPLNGGYAPPADSTPPSPSPGAGAGAGDCTISGTPGRDHLVGDFRRRRDLRRWRG